MKFFSPAKINIFLKVLGKREDGFHEVASLYQAIDLFDEIDIEFSEQDQFTTNSLDLAMDESNLAVKAVNLFRNQGHSFFVKLHLQKRIPLSSGLGGGSSNAATVLKGLNELLNFPYELDELVELSAKLGSDVPFFIHPGAAYCTGRGEKIKKIKSLERESVWIVKPPFGLSTPEVYKCVDLNTLKTKEPREALQSILLGRLESFNDLENAAFSLQPALMDLKNDLLQQGYHSVTMSGSGSAFFCIGGGEPNLPSNYFVRRASFI